MGWRHVLRGKLRTYDQFREEDFPKLRKMGVTLDGKRDFKFIGRSVIRYDGYDYDLGDFKVVVEQVVRRPTLCRVQLIPLTYDGTFHPHSGPQYNRQTKKWTYYTCIGYDFVQAYEDGRIYDGVCNILSVLNNRGYDGANMYECIDFQGICQDCLRRLSTRTIRWVTDRNTKREKIICSSCLIWNQYRYTDVCVAEQ